jgi:hypothetical protein
MTNKRIKIIKDSDSSDSDHESDSSDSEPEPESDPDDPIYEPEHECSICGSTGTCSCKLLYYSMLYKSIMDITNDAINDPTDESGCCPTVPTTTMVPVVPTVPVVPEQGIKHFKLNKDIKVCTGVSDLIKLLESEDPAAAVTGQKDLQKALIDLDNLVGMTSLKSMLVNQILFFLQNLQEPGTFLHTVITGDPGTGKTTLINVLSRIYKSMGFLKHNGVVKADRTDFIAEYLGQTAIKTKKVLEKAKGGILLIDEAYSLGSEGNDSFSKECIDTINQYLSEKVDDLICIICGYEFEIEQCFFKKNNGLSRRFPWRFHISSYSPEELYQILKIQLGPQGAAGAAGAVGAVGTQWSIDLSESEIVKLIKDNSKYFDGNGGSTRSLLDKCKILYAQSRFNDPVKTLPASEDPQTTTVAPVVPVTPAATKRSRYVKKGLERGPQAPCGSGSPTGARNGPSIPCGAPCGSGSPTGAPIMHVISKTNFIEGLELHKISHKRSETLCSFCIERTLLQNEENQCTKCNESKISNRLMYS